MLAGGVSVSWGCCNKLPQAWWLKAPERHYLAVWRPDLCLIQGWAGWTPPRTLGGLPRLSSLWRLRDFHGGGRLTPALPRLPRAFLCLLFCVLFLVRTLDIGFRVCLEWSHLKITNLITPVETRPFFPDKVPFKVLGVEVWTCFSGGYPSTHHSKESFQLWNP